MINSLLALFGQWVDFIVAFYGITITIWHALNCAIIAILISFSSLHHQEERMYRISGILGYVLAAASAWISIDIISGGYEGYTKTSDWAQVLVITIIIIVVRGDMDKLFHVARRLWGYSRKLKGK